MVQSVKEAITRIEAITELTGKVAYDHFSEAKQLPFACYLYDFDTSGADDYHGIQWINFRLELYAKIRNFPLENKILKALSDVEITSDSDYLSDERMYITTFNFRFPQKISNVAT
jgi:hypothetical protein